MRAVTERDEALPPRYHLFPAALFHDLQSVWRKRSKGFAEARYKSLFESVFADRHTTIPDKTFRNWTNGTTSIDRKKAFAFLTVFLENWSEGIGQPLCFCDHREARCNGECEDKRRLCRERLLNHIFSFDDKPQDHVFVLPSPGYSSQTVCKLHAQKGWDLLFPVDTAHAHSWDEEHFFRSFSIVETFVKNRHTIKKPRFIYVIKPFTLNADRRQLASARHWGSNLSDSPGADGASQSRDQATEFPTRSSSSSRATKAAPKSVPKLCTLPEELLMPNRLAEAFSLTVAGKKCGLLIDLYIKKQMKIHGTKIISIWWEGTIRAHSPTI